MGLQLQIQKDLAIQGTFLMMTTQVHCFFFQIRLYSIVYDFPYMG